jgi:hypothetical protein
MVLLAPRDVTAAGAAGRSAADRRGPRSPRSGELWDWPVRSNRSWPNLRRSLTFRSSRERLLVVTTRSSSLHPEMALRRLTFAKRAAREASLLGLSHGNRLYETSTPETCSSALKTRALSSCSSTTRWGPSHRTSSIGPPHEAAGARPWPVSALNVLPGRFGGAEDTERIVACVLKGVVAPQLRSNTATLTEPSGDGYSAT